jgi:AcrR family transcriptional regulator
MERLATKVGVTAGNLYNYFRNKDELLQFFYSRLVEPAYQAAVEIADADLPASQKVERILYSAWEDAIKHKALLQLLAGLNQDSELRRNTRPRVLALLTRVFQQGIDEGTFRPHNPAHTARMYLACLSELFAMQGDGESDEEVNSFAKTLIEATVSGYSIHAKPHLDRELSKDKTAEKGNDPAEAPGSE